MRSAELMVIFVGTRRAVSEKNQTEGQNEHKGCRMAIMLYEL